MQLGISYEEVLEYAKNNAYGNIERFEFGPVKYLNYRDLTKDRIFVDEGGVHTDCGDIELLFVNDKLVFSFYEALRDKNPTRESLIAWRYATNILLSAAFYFDSRQLYDDPDIDEEVKKTAKWLNKNAESMRILVLRRFAKFVAEDEYLDFKCRLAYQYLSVDRDIQDVIQTTLK